MTSVKSLQDIYNAAIKRWFKWEDIHFDKPEFYEGHRELFVGRDSSLGSYSWMRTQFVNSLEIIVEENLENVFSIVKAECNKDIMEKNFKRLNVTNEDVKNKNGKFVNAIVTTILDQEKFYEDGSKWGNAVIKDYSRFISEKIKKFEKRNDNMYEYNRDNYQFMRGVQVSAPRRRTSSKKHTPAVRVNVRKMF